MYNLGECVLIKNGFFASQEAKDLAEGKNIKNFKPIGTVIKLLQIMMILPLREQQI